MSCSFSSPSDIEHYHKSCQQNINKGIPGLQSEKITHLPRGGCIVKTNKGNVQFGIPPETVKDSMMMGLEVPVYYVVPTNRFDNRVCLNVAEFEFPAYFNFFVRKRTVNLICTQEAEKAIRTVFQETLLGPLSFEVN